MTTYLLTLSERANLLWDYCLLIAAGIFCLAAVIGMGCAIARARRLKRCQEWCGEQTLRLW